MEHSHVTVGTWPLEGPTAEGVRLHVVSDGPKSGPLVILLHGFPEIWWSWRAYIPALAARGYRVLVPDQRGYGSSDKPAGVAAYDLDVLAADVVSLIEHEGRSRAFVVGHDFGAMVTWWLALRRPERVERMVAMNVPHPLAMRDHMLTRWTQLRKSWYVLMFQVPGLAEGLTFGQDGGRLAKTLEATSRPGTFTQEDLEAYRAAWRQPGAPTAMLSWYRAAFRRVISGVPAHERRVHVPAMLVWGPDDAVLDRALAPASMLYCDRGRLEMLDGSTHWVHHDAAARVATLLLDFLG